ncbi:hypothetical protein [Mesorhizobium sp. Root157]|uniref:hypothetical protein n=1 Tax=Mesorhizobium sp. Root157 TaxID=1736477 RepID=UPI000A9B55BC|nr:hypothetical protein [Mesorhizobium sp. Root157]
MTAHIEPVAERAKLERWQSVLIAAGVHPLKAILIIALVAGDRADERKEAA